LGKKKVSSESLPNGFGGYNRGWSETETTVPPSKVGESEQNLEGKVRVLRGRGREEEEEESPPTPPTQLEDEEINKQTFVRSEKVDSDMGDEAPRPSSTGRLDECCDDFSFSIPYQCDKEVASLSIEELCRSSAVYNVELSWLAFNWRVLSMACNKEVPMLERLTYLGISASNLDEFFAKRVGGLKRQLEASKADKLITSENDDLIWTPDYQLKLIADNVKQFAAQQHSILSDHLEPSLASEANIHIVKSFEDLSAREKERLHLYFVDELELLLTPIKLDPGHPFPCLQSLSLGIAVRLQEEETTQRKGRDKKKDEGDREEQENNNSQVSYAVVTIPSTVDRWIKLETDLAEEEGGNTSSSFQKIAYLPLEQLIISHLGQLFGGWRILDAWTYRVTRNAELARDEDEAEDLLEMIAEEVRERMFAPFVRLEVQQGTPSELVDLLVHELQLNAERDVYNIESLLDLAALKTLNVSNDSNLSKFKFPKYIPVASKLASVSDLAADDKPNSSCIFDEISRNDFLVHHPYESFESSTLRFLEEAATDPNVLAIKATVYRTSSNSPVIDALIRAAERRKQVAVLMELKARFDEARNVTYAQELEAAGCSITYGLIGLKTHCKVMLVVRKEKGSGSAGLRTYVHIGTGNYNPVTAGLYSDFSLFSCDPLLGRDVMDVFKHLTGLHRQHAVGGYRKLLVAQIFMRDQFIQKIDREIENAKAGKHASILLKVNGLDDRALVAKLYEASRANVRVDCIVRGVCRLRPGVKGMSENIRVISVLGRYLEHHRVAVFHNSGHPDYFIGSADWMTRNLSRRVEVATPVEDDGIRANLCDILSCYLNDKRAFEMLPDGTYQQQASRCDESFKNACLVPGERLRSETKHIMKRSAKIGTQSALQEFHRRSRTTPPST
jgi:polyphosphate kinase